jgi:hypothetical protein
MIQADYRAWTQLRICLTKLNYPRSFQIPAKFPAAGIFQGEGIMVAADTMQQIVSLGVLRPAAMPALDERVSLAFGEN